MKSSEGEKEQAIPLPCHGERRNGGRERAGPEWSVAISLPCHGERRSRCRQRAGPEWSVAISGDENGIRAGVQPRHSALIKNPGRTKSSTGVHICSTFARANAVYQPRCPACTSSIIRACPLLPTILILANQLSMLASSSTCSFTYQSRKFLLA